jgi:phosphatidylserine/phosphatidylglycerophosphate/cardiolipin synthase-like enzyme
MLQRRFRRLSLSCAVLLLTTLPQPASAADAIFFPAVDNVTSILVARINAETVRIDLSAWFLTERAISIALVNRVKAGVPVRLLGDRVALFETDPLTKREFYWLASQGVPIRLRYHPTWYPDINHWKATIFAGQNLVAFGSANYTPFELAPASATNYKDETVLFTTDTPIVNGFRTKFDRFWNDTTAEPGGHVPAPPYFKNFNEACALEPACADYRVLYPAPQPMIISTARIEPDYPLPADIVWSQGPEFNRRLVEEIDREVARVDLVVYRLTAASVVDALERKARQGVPVRLIIEPEQYVNRDWPEYWLSHVFVDRLWAAGVSIRQRAHVGLTHMKMLVTTNVATNGSSNLAEGWQRDHNYFVRSTIKPALHQAMRQRFETMWSDPVGFTAFVPRPPDAPGLSRPAHGATQIGARPTLTWQRAAFAASYDVYLGGTPTTLALAGTVAAQLVSDPPLTYSWTPPSNLQTATVYYWAVVAKTAAASAVGPTWSFTTEGVVNPPPTPRPRTDFTGDGNADLIWQHASNGSISSWFMVGTQMVGAAMLTPSRVADTNWKIVGTGDVNGDGWPDLFWQHQVTGQISTWFMVGTQMVGASMLSPSQVADTNWKIAAVGDVNGDSKPDLVWQHQTSGLLSVWLMNGPALTRAFMLTPDRVADLNWKIVGIGDLNADAHPDLVWQHRTTGQVSTWLMNGTKMLEGRLLTPGIVADLDWRIRAVADVNRDGMDDLIWQHRTQGLVSTWLMNGTSLAAGALLTPSRVADTDWQIVGPN